MNEEMNQLNGHIYKQKKEERKAWKSIVIYEKFSKNMKELWKLDRV